LLPNSLKLALIAKSTHVDKQPLDTSTWNAEIFSAHDVTWAILPYVPY